MKIVSFVVRGEPMGKGRPKFSTRSGFVRAVTPEKTAHYENLVKLEYQAQCENVYLEGALEAELVAYFSIPKSTSKRNRLLMEEGKILHTKKCDADNVAKIVLDALNGIAYHDDSQVSVLTVRKKYGNTPRVEVTIKSLEGCS